MKIHGGDWRHAPRKLLAALMSLRRHADRLAARHFRRDARDDDDPSGADGTGDGPGVLRRLRRRLPKPRAAGGASLEEIENAVAGERDKSAALQRTIDDLKFRMGMLEKGYTKQLEDARHAADRAQRSLAERDAELADVGARYEAAAEALDKARGELERVTRQRDRLQRQIDGYPESDDEDDADLPEGTINRLLAVASRPRRRAVPSAAEDDAAPAGTDDMLAPELMLRQQDTDED